mmetsp:Transcript_91151/g.283554  ORF Transcript_91151/g.283554 Transcript_91151/m.283554 type:complete len:199 (-) Transcript_91151:229-825(-)
MLAEVLRPTAAALPAPRGQRGAALLLLTGTALLLAGRQGDALRGGGLAFTVAPAGGLATAPRPWTRPRERSGALTAAGADPNRRVPKWPWVEPTIPQELVDQAREEGFRLRPRYNHMKIGYVVSDKNIKTRVAHVEYFLFNAKYGAYYKRSKKFHYHDEYEVSKLGDVVIIGHFKKRSKMKNYRLIEVMKKNTAPTHV